MKYGDLISRQDFDKCLEDAEKEAVKNRKYVFASALNTIRGNLRNFPSAQPEQRYTKEELRVFQHGISISLLSKRSAQHWKYDEDRDTEIKFLERLYEKVGADMRGEQDE